MTSWGTHTWGPFHCFYQTISREVGQNWSSLDIYHHNFGLKCEKILCRGGKSTWNSFEMCGASKGGCLFLKAKAEDHSSCSRCLCASFNSLLSVLAAEESRVSTATPTPSHDLKCLYPLLHFSFLSNSHSLLMQVNKNTEFVLFPSTNKI